jgi:hypothetical protein
MFLCSRTFACNGPMSLTAGRKQFAALPPTRFHQPKHVGCISLIGIGVAVQSQRDCGSKPKIGASAATLGMRSKKATNANGVAATLDRLATAIAATALRLRMAPASDPG